MAGLRKPGGLMSPAVLIASPMETVRRRWRRGLRGRFTIHEVDARPALLRSVAAIKPSILLLDLPHPGGARVSLHVLRRLSPLTAIVLLTGKPEDKQGILALKAGARGYGSKNIAPLLLRRALKRIQAGEIWAGRKLVSSLLDELASVIGRRQARSRGRPGARDAGLTLRQREIAVLVSGGATNKEIASRLNITPRAVKAHLTVVFRKLGLSNRLQLALFVTGQSRASP